MARIRLLFQTIAVGVTINFINAYTVLDIVNNLSNHTNLAAAVAQDEQVVALLQNTSLKLTLFAPSDAAFAQLSDGMMTRLMSQPYEMHLNCLLTAHVIPRSRVFAGTMLSSLILDSARPGYRLSLAKSDAGALSVNGIPADQADLSAENGVVHCITGVLLPPCVSTTLFTRLQADKFSTMRSLVEAAGLVDILSEFRDNGLTLLAPNNDAFSAVPPALLNYLGSNVEVLKSVLTYHIIPENLASKDMSGDIQSWHGDPLSFVAGNVITVNGATIVAWDKLSINGFQHELNGVLVPPSLDLSGIDLDGSDTATQSILQVVSNSPVHTTLTAAVNSMTEAVSLLGDVNETLTLFAPDDAAFASFNSMYNDTLTRFMTEAYSDHLACLLGAHILDGKYLTSDIKASTNLPLVIDSLQHGASVSLNVQGDVVTANNFPISVPDIPASNGVVHSLSDGAFRPPCATQDIVAYLASNPDYSEFVTLVQSAAGGSDIVTLTQSTAQGRTLFAPNNQAFADAPQNLMGKLNEDPVFLQQVLSYHVVDKNLPTKAMASGPVTTLDGSETVNLTVSEAGVNVNGAYTIVMPDVLTSNGIIHGIDGILIPPNVSSTISDEVPATSAPVTVPVPAPVLPPTPVPISTPMPVLPEPALVPQPETPTVTGDFFFPKPKPKPTPAGSSKSKSKSGKGGKAGKKTSRSYGLETEAVSGGKRHVGIVAAILTVFVFVQF